MCTNEVTEVQLPFVQAVFRRGQCPQEQVIRVTQCINDVFKKGINRDGKALENQSLHLLEPRHDWPLLHIFQGFAHLSFQKYFLRFSLSFPVSPIIPSYIPAHHTE